MNKQLNLFKPEPSYMQFARENNLSELGFCWLLKDTIGTQATLDPRTPENKDKIFTWMEKHGTYWHMNDECFKYRKELYKKIIEFWEVMHNERTN